MSIRRTLVNRLRRATLRTQLTTLYAGLLLVVVAVVLVGAAFLFRTATAPAGVETNDVHSRYFEIGAAIVIVLVVLVGLWFAWQLAGLYLRPLRTLNATARDIAATNLHRRLGLQGPDNELTQLGGTFDDLFGRLESSFESQRRFVANASHELRTPLAGQRTLLQVALADPDATSDSLRAACEEALALGERQERLVDGLLTLASSERGIEHREPLDLAEIAQRALISRQHEAAPPAIPSSSRACSPTCSTTPSSTTSPTAASTSRPAATGQPPSSQWATPVLSFARRSSSDYFSPSSGWETTEQDRATVTGSDWPSSKPSPTPTPPRSPPTPGLAVDSTSRSASPPPTTRSLPRNHRQTAAPGGLGPMSLAWLAAAGP
jgi:HAMP domain-containing protein